jgi:hypothetical protein
MPTPFIGVAFGLLEHRARMGSAWWLYFFLHTRADFHDPTGQVTFTLDEAAAALKASRRSAQLWYKRLKDEAYIEPTGDDSSAHKTIRITKYKSVPLMARRERSFAGHASSFAPPAQDLARPTIIYKYTSYRTLKGFFEAAVDMINQAHNPIAELRRFWQFVWGTDGTPDFGRLGEAAQRAGNGQSRPGCRVLAMRSVVAAVGRRVLGNPIDYVQKMQSTSPDAPPSSRPGRGTPPARRRGDTAPAASQWQEPDHGDWDRYVIDG